MSRYDLYSLEAGSGMNKGPITCGERISMKGMIIDLDYSLHRTH